MRKNKSMTNPSNVKVKENTKVIKNINKEVLNLNEHHMKNFINFDIKLDAETKVKHKNTPEVNKNHGENSTQGHIKDLVNLFRTSEENCLRIQDEIIQGKEPNLEMLRNEIKNLRIQNEFYKTKAKFYEKIFYTTKNCMETSSERDSNELKRKLESIMTQNNKYYYDELNFETQRDESNFKRNTLMQIEERLVTLLKELHQFEQKGNFLISEVKEKISHSLKGILSFYFLSKDFSFEFKDKSLFYLENEGHYFNLERKQRTKEILSDWENFLDNPKKKKETLTKVEQMINFYENFNLVFKSESINIKQDASNCVNFFQQKINHLHILIDCYLQNVKDPLGTIREILPLVDSSHLKNKDKVIATMLSNDRENLSALIQSYDNLINNYSLIK